MHTLHFEVGNTRPATLLSPFMGSPFVVTHLADVVGPALIKAAVLEDAHVGGRNDVQPGVQPGIAFHQSNGGRGTSMWQLFLGLRVEHGAGAKFGTIHICPFVYISALSCLITAALAHA